MQEEWVVAPENVMCHPLAPLYQIHLCAVTVKAVDHPDPYAELQVGDRIYLLNEKNPYFLNDITLTTSKHAPRPL